MYRATTEKYLLKWLSAAAILGSAGGLGAVALKRSVAFIENIGVAIPLCLAPIIGGILVAVICKLDMGASGNGTDSFLAAVNEQDGQIPIKTAFTKMIATAVTLGFKGSGGFEGPILVVGGTLGNALRRLPYVRKLWAHESRLLCLCGAAGALGAIFHSPLGGGIFVVELAYRSSLHYADLFPAVLSSTIGNVVYSSLGGGEPMFTIPKYLPSVESVLWFIAAGVIGGLLALVFIYVFKHVHQQFERLGNSFVKPIIGGLVTGVVLLFVPQVAGVGADMIQQLILDKTMLGSTIMIMVLAKVLATSYTVGSGQSAGLVIPALFIGAFGGRVIADFAGGTPFLDASLIVAGMTACLAGVANVPIAAAVILIEMGGLQIAVPAVIGSVVGFAITHKQLIYETDPESGELYDRSQAFRKQDLQPNSH